jgi:hypothetical protein
MIDGVVPIHLIFVLGLVITAIIRAFRVMVILVILVLSDSLMLLTFLGFINMRRLEVLRMLSLYFRILCGNFIICRFLLHLSICN